MTDTPKPKPFPAPVVSLTARRQRREATQEFDTRSGQTRVPPELMPADPITDPDGPPTDEMEIPIPLTELASVPTASMLDPFSLLEETTFEAQAIIRSEREPRGPKYYEILSGYAHMRSADDQGQPKNNPRDLGPGDFIGLIGFSRVVSKTVLRVRVYDLPKIAAMNNPHLHLAAQGRLFAAAADQATTYGRENAKLRERIAEYDAVIRANLDEYKERFIRPLREEIAAKNEELLEKNEHIARLEKDRLADSQSLVLILDDFEELVEEGVLDASEVRIAEVVSIFEPTLTAMSTCGDNAIMTKAMKALGELHTFKMKQPAKVPIRKKPAT